MNRPVPAPVTSPEGETLASGLFGAFTVLEDGAVAGYVANLDDLSQRLVVELVIDGVPGPLARADLFHSGLERRGLGDGCYGFHIVPPAELTLRAETVAVRVANSLAPLPPDGEGGAAADVATTPGEVEWSGALRLSGWVPAGAGRPVIAVSVDGTPVAEVAADVWALAAVAGTTRPVRRFNVTLPEEFADGQVHRVSVEAQGRALRGAPLTILAYPDGLRAVMAGIGAPGEALERAELFDALLPRCRDFADYPAWVAQVLAPADPGETDIPLGVVVLGEEGIDATIASLSDDRTPWVGGVLASDAAQAQFTPRDLSVFLSGEAAACGAVLFLPAGTQLRPGALTRLRAAFAAAGTVDLVLCDLDVVEPGGGLWPLALPLADEERMLEQGYGARLFALRRAPLQKALEAGADTVFRLAIGGFGEGTERIAHLPGAVGTVPAACLKRGGEALRAAVAAHLGARREAGRIGLRQGAGAVMPRLRVARTAGRAPVTVVIDMAVPPDIAPFILPRLTPPVVARGGRLVLLVPEQSGDAVPGAPDEAEIVRVPPGRRVATLDAVLAQSREGDLCVIGAGLVPQSEDWLDALLSRLRGARAGLAAPLLRFESGAISDAGLVLGHPLDAVPAFCDRAAGDPGYADLLEVAHEVGALDGRAFAVAAGTLARLGGLDAVRFPDHFWGVDLSLRARAAGLRLVVTPDATFTDLVGRPEGAALAGRRLRERAALRARWGAALAADPCYTPILAQDGRPYGGLAWPAPALRPRVASAIRPSELPPGL